MGSWRFSIFFLGSIIVLIGMWALLFIKNRCAAQYNPNLRVIKTTRPTGDDIV